MNTRLFVMLALSLSACRSGSVAVSAKQSHIIGGEPEVGYPAVGVLVFNAGALCTGTLISRQIVLTAAHCVAVGHSGRFFIGPSVKSANQVIPFTRALEHPQYSLIYVSELKTTMPEHDVGLVVLDRPAKDVTPIKYRASVINKDMLNQPVLFVGYGVTSPGGGSFGVKYSVPGHIDMITDQGIVNIVDDPAQPRNTCQGDSGGPVLYSGAGGVEVIGTVSAGDIYCKYYGYNIRLDRNASWIAKVAAQYDGGPLTAVCGDGVCGIGETPQNCSMDCAGNAVCGNGKCEQGEDVDSCPKDCSSTRCGDGLCEGGENYQVCPYDCSTPQCAGVTYGGCCDQRKLHYCDEYGWYQTKDCGSLGLQCGWVEKGGKGYYDCTDAPNRDPSGTYSGNCPSLAVICGNGMCDGDEDCHTCPNDCGVCKTVCGNGKCEAHEDCHNCPVDCGGCSTPDAFLQDTVQRDATGVAPPDMSAMDTSNALPSPFSHHSGGCTMSESLDIRNTGSFFLFCLLGLSLFMLYMRRT